MPVNHSFDGRLLHWIAEHRVHWVTWSTTRLMDAGQSLVLFGLVAAAGLVVVAVTRAWRPGLAVAVAYFGSGITAGLLKNHIQRARPGIPDAIAHLGGYAMPSTHAAFTMAPAIALLVVVRWRSRRMLASVATLLGAGVMLVGVSMVYLGAHWATDVLAGWALGIVLGVGVGVVFNQRTGQSTCASTHRSAAEGHHHQ